MKSVSQQEDLEINDNACKLGFVNCFKMQSLPILHIFVLCTSYHFRANMAQMCAKDEELRPPCIKTSFCSKLLYIYYTYLLYESYNIVHVYNYYN